MLMLLIFLFSGACMILWGSHLNIRFLLYLGFALCFYGIITTAAWGLARYVIPGNRIEVARGVISKLKLNGNEKVIDVGSGRGLYAIEAAKQLVNGSIVAIDIWDPKAVPKLKFQHKLSQPTGNTLENAKQNAECAGVSSKIEFRNMDVNFIDFESGSFDAAICGFVLGHLKQHRRKAIREVYRVLKKEGQLILVDNVRDFVYFLLSTPHLFVLSLLRNTKARQLTRKKWLEDILASGFKIETYSARKGIIILKAVK